MRLHDFILCLEAMRNPIRQTKNNYEYLWHLWSFMTKTEKAEVRLALAK